eukprot:TRINITY_DN14813_c0_g1_i1.p1 TRINITY_DN14813_c0_g1~~TRINITY_DN14813_c0_g1_i1.p1  ORF type:complete len:212 (+),score=33.62 TRINITY_DN14813_c0_g1_i1:86-721(+)
MCDNQVLFNAAEPSSKETAMCAVLPVHILDLPLDVLEDILALCYDHKDHLSWRLVCARFLKCGQFSPVDSKRIAMRAANNSAGAATLDLMFKSERYFRRRRDIHESGYPGNKKGHIMNIVMFDLKLQTFTKIKFIRSSDGREVYLNNPSFIEAMQLYCNLEHAEEPYIRFLSQYMYSGELKNDRRGRSFAYKDGDEEYTMHRLEYLEPPAA